MALPNLDLPPDQAQYAGTFGPTFLSTQLLGGASRFRADYVGMVFLVTVQWTLNKTNYNYLTAFFRTAITNGADFFTIDLMLDSGDMQSYTVHFKEGTFQLYGQQGETYVVQATLEVVPDPSYSSSDATIIAAGPDV